MFLVFIFIVHLKKFIMALITVEYNLKYFAMNFLNFQILILLT